MQSCLLSYLSGQWANAWTGFFYRGGAGTRRFIVLNAAGLLRVFLFCQPVDYWLFTRAVGERLDRFFYRGGAGTRRWKNLIIWSFFEFFCFASRWFYGYSPGQWANAWPP